MLSGMPLLCSSILTRYSACGLKHLSVRVKRLDAYRAWEEQAGYYHACRSLENVTGFFAIAPGASIRCR